MKPLNLNIIIYDLNISINKGHKFKLQRALQKLMHKGHKFKLQRALQTLMHKGH